MSNVWTASLQALKPGQNLLFWLGFAALGVSLTSISEARLLHEGSKTTKILDAEAMNLKANPCENFYEYACGKWQKKARIKKGTSATYRQSDSFDELVEIKIRNIMKQMSLEEPAKIYFQSCLLPKDRKTNLETIRPFLNAIKNYKSSEDLAKVVALLHSYSIPAFFSFEASASLSDSETMIGYFSAGGKTFANRDIYFKNEKLANQMRLLLPLHIQKLLKAFGFPELANPVLVGQVIQFEKELAAGSLAKADWNNPKFIHHPASGKDVEAAFPNFPIRIYLKARNIPDAFDSFNLSEPLFLRTLDRLLKQTDSAQIKTYLIWRVAADFAASLSEETYAEYFNFWSKNWKGIEKPDPLWKRCLDSAAGKFQEDFWKTYVHSLPDGPNSLSSGRKIIEGIKSEFDLRMRDLTWMDAATKSRALLKLSKFSAKVGYPTAWTTEQKVRLQRENYLKNALVIRSEGAKKNVSLLGERNPKEEWGMAPWDINAMYSAEENIITIPYATLIPPTLDPQASFGANMGSFGFTVGHELTHGFDSDGRLYDGYGNANDWWTPQATQEFEKRSECLKQQADNYEILKGLHINGENTLGENIADSGGLRLAYNLLKRERGSQYRKTDAVGFSEEQEFFISYAQSWCTKKTEKSLRSNVISDAHAPAEFRVNGALANMPEFGEAFQCRQSVDRMSPAVRCEVW
ncbi:MAG: M13 family metallopeptidase [Bdellovibrionales bacterium]|nr:M13 family metallopeptidase [Bdellovibrionales bacterium]